MDMKEDKCSLPRKPEEPSQADCCGSGCSYCVFDVYQKELSKWKKDCERILMGGKHSEGTDTLSVLEFRSFPLISITRSAEELNIYRFSVPEGLRLDIKPGQHLIMKGWTINPECDGVTNIENETTDVGSESVMRTVNRTDVLQQTSGETFLKRKYLSRSYTILNNEQGYFETLIKVYHDGEMSRYIRTLKVGESCLWRGPFGDYCHEPSYSQSCEDGPKTILAICAGTGVAPAYAISKSIVSDERDETRIRLLWANHLWKYLPLVQEFKELISYWNFSCRLFISEGNDIPCGSETFFEVTRCKISFEALMEELEFVLGSKLKVLLCGSLSFEEDMLAFLNQLGIQDLDCHRFQ